METVVAVESKESWLKAMTPPVPSTSFRHTLNLCCPLTSNYTGGVRYAGSTYSKTLGDCVFECARVCQVHHIPLWPGLRETYPPYHRTLSSYKTLGKHEVEGGLRLPPVEVAGDVPVQLALHCGDVLLSQGQDLAGRQEEGGAGWQLGR